MGNEEKNREKDATESPQPLKVSKAIFDEATGTVTLTLATDEEIAEDERIKKEREEGIRKAYCVLMTGETVKYGNIILKKGVIPF